MIIYENGQQIEVPDEEIEIYEPFKENKENENEPGN